MTKKTFQLDTFSCPSCGIKIESMLKKIKGVNSSEVLYNSSRVKIDFDESIVNAEELAGKIRRLGFDVLSVK